MMQVITNTYPRVNHKTHLLSLIEQADEIKIASAFLKESGLNLIFTALQGAIARNTDITIIAGQHFALTEPAALLRLHNLFHRRQNCKLHLANALSASQVFHPKIYLFRHGSEYTLITGSANITEGGLVSNTECSFLHSGTTDEAAYRQVVSFFETMLLPALSVEATLLAIRQYQSFYEEQRIHNRNSRAIPSRRQVQYEFNYENLRRWFRTYDNLLRHQEYNSRVQKYQVALEVLNTIADTEPLTRAEFEPLLERLIGKKGETKFKLWHSGSLVRNKSAISPQYLQFQNLVRYIRENIGETTSLLYAEAKNLLNNINGAGPNFVTEIMMTYDHERFANLNNNPIKVLRNEGGVHLKAVSRSFTGSDYEDYCNLVGEICDALGLHNMLEADSFFNDIYWRI